MKTPLIIGAGKGWCATSPLHLTLQCATKCSHTGILKEDHLLYNIYNKDAWGWREYWYKRLVNDSMTPNWKHPYGYQSKYGFHNNLEEIEELFTRNPTLQTYIKYYKRHYQRVKHEYKYVHDFSNSNALLPRNFLAKIAPVLKKHFDIKVLMIFRDPVRRLYSELSQKYQDSPNLQKSYNTSKDYWKSYLKKGKITQNSDYIWSFKSYNEFFSTISIVSEELWDGKNNCQEKLAKFLDFDIKELWPNAYFPEMGTKAPHHEYLKDQWSSDLEDLTEEDLEFGRKYMKKYYDEWYDYFGSMPWRC
tara:strand:- start:5757 stop:6668 length:912 start_codon:yes stop_codon:yes gene_type:complete